MADLAGAYADARLAAARDSWTDGQVRTRRQRTVEALVADPFELFRALSGRRTLDQVRALAWDGDPAPYLDLFAPYPMPTSPLVDGRLAA